MALRTVFVIVLLPCGHAAGHTEGTAKPNGQPGFSSAVDSATRPISRLVEGRSVVLPRVTLPNAARRIQGLVNALCRTQGWSMAELSALTGFRPRPGKGRKHPPTIRFVNLAEKPWYVEGRTDRVVLFEIGLGRTPEDPRGGKVMQHWSEHMGPFAREVHDVTAYAGFYCDLDTAALCIDHLQTSRLLKADTRGVLLELGRRFGPGAAGFAARARRTLEHGVPWAYPDRMMLLGATAGLLALELGAPQLVLPRRPDVRYCGEETYQRSVSFLGRIVHELSAGWIDQGLCVAQPLARDYWQLH